MWFLDGYAEFRQSGRQILHRQAIFTILETFGSLRTAMAGRCVCGAHFAVLEGVIGDVGNELLGRN